MLLLEAPGHFLKNYTNYERYENVTKFVALRLDMSRDLVYTWEHNDNKRKKNGFGSVPHSKEVCTQV